MLEVKHVRNILCQPNQLNLIQILAIILNLFYDLVIELVVPFDNELIILEPLAISLLKFWLICMYRLIKVGTLFK